MDILQELKKGRTLRFVCSAGGDYCLITVKQLGDFYHVLFQTEGESVTSYIFSSRDLLWLLEGATPLPLTSIQ